jgi:hypothetical protein
VWFKTFEFQPTSLHWETMELVGLATERLYGDIQILVTNENAAASKFEKTPLALLCPRLDGS